MKKKRLLEKYFEVKCSPEEQQQIEDYLQQDPAVLPQYFDKVLQEVETELQQKKAGVVPMRSRTKRLLLYAAAIIAIIIIPLSYLLMVRPQQYQAAKQAPKEQWYAIANQGQLPRLVTMPDGSRIWLCAFSTLSYNNRYDVETRELKLKGQAYFEVAPNEHPFSVSAGRLTTLALGTAFNIQAYPDSTGYIAVALLSGKVKVYLQDNEEQAPEGMILTPGQMSTLSYSREALKRTDFNTAEILDWKKGLLAFKQLPMEQVFLKLSQRFGCSIHYNQELIAGKRISGTFNQAAGVEAILRSILFVHHLQLQRKGNGYTIQPENM